MGITPWMARSRAQRTERRAARYFVGLSDEELDQYSKPLIDRVRTAHLIFRALLSQGRAFS